MGVYYLSMGKSWVYWALMVGMIGEKEFLGRGVRSWYFAWMSLRLWLGMPTRARCLLFVGFNNVGIYIDPSG
jgi:hypothetical protein